MWKYAMKKSDELNSKLIMSKLISQKKVTGKHTPKMFFRRTRVKNGGESEHKQYMN